MSSAAVRAASVLSCDPAALAALVAERWPGCARRRGLDPEAVGIELADGGLLRCVWSRYPDDRARKGSVFAREELARDLEDVGYEVERLGDAIRVVGWAAWSPSARSPLRRLLDIESADVRDPRALAWRDRLQADRHSRDAATAPAPNLKLAHARGQR